MATVMPARSASLRPCSVLPGRDRTPRAMHCLSCHAHASERHIPSALGRRARPPMRCLAYARAAAPIRLHAVLHLAAPQTLPRAPRRCLCTPVTLWTTRLAELPPDPSRSLLLTPHRCLVELLWLLRAALH